MNEQDFKTIEENLELQLPDDYRELLTKRLSELKQVEWFEDEDSALYLNVDDLLQINRGEQPSDSATSDAFPGWAETFFIIGTNGGGDFYCLKRDATPGVWMIGSDCGDEPSLVAESFEQYVEGLLQDWKEELESRAEMEQRRQLRAEETDAHLSAIE